MASKASKETSIATQEEENTAVVLIHVQTDTLNRWDLIHNLTIQNTSGIVKAETLEGLVAAAAKYGKPDAKNALRQSLAYYVYKHTNTLTGKAQVCIAPMPERFMEDIKTVEKVYTKPELVDVTHNQNWIDNLPSLSNNWNEFHENIKTYLQYYANANYNDQVLENVTRYNNKISERADKKQKIIEFDERNEAICFGRAPFKSDFTELGLQMHMTRISPPNSSEDEAEDETEALRLGLEKTEKRLNDLLQYDDEEIVFGSAHRPRAQRLTRPAELASRPQLQSTARRHKPNHLQRTLQEAEHIRSLNGGRSSDRKPYEFGKVIDYTMFDPKCPESTPDEFFSNLIHEIEANLKRGNIYTVEIDTIIRIIKSVITQKEKRSIFEQNAKDIRSLPELREAFTKTVTIPKSLRIAQFSKIQQKPKHVSWPDFATKFEKQFELSFDQDAEGGKNSVLFDRFLRCLTTPKQKNTMEHFLLMVEENQHSIHLLAEKLELMESMEFGQREVDRHELNRIQTRQKNEQKTIVCSYCNIKGHSRQECRKRQGVEGRKNNNHEKRNHSQRQNRRDNDRMRPKCGRCGRSNHNTADCYANLEKNNNSRFNNRNYNRESKRSTNQRNGQRNDRSNQNSSSNRNRTLERPRHSTNYRMNSFPGQ